MEGTKVSFYQFYLELCIDLGRAANSSSQEGRIIVNSPERCTCVYIYRKMGDSIYLNAVIYKRIELSKLFR
jgi:hypothetical protein